MTNNIHFCLYLIQFFLEWEMFHTKSCRANQNTQFMFNNFLRKSCLLWDNLEKCRAGQATGHAHCMLDT